MDTKLLLVCSSPTPRAGLLTALRQRSPFHDVVEASSVDQAVDLSLTGEFQIILVEVQPSGADGLRALCAACNGARVIGFSRRADARAFWSSIEAGAHGFVFQTGNDITELLHALERAQHEEYAFCSTSLGYLTQAVRSQRLQSVDDALNARETAVLRHVAGGARNRDIAAALHLSESTVKAVIAKIFRKMGVRSRAAAAARFVEAQVP